MKGKYGPREMSAEACLSCLYLLVPTSPISISWSLAWRTTKIKVESGWDPQVTSFKKVWIANTSLIFQGLRYFWCALPLTQCFLLKAPQLSSRSKWQYVKNLKLPSNSTIQSCTRENGVSWAKISKINVYNKTGVLMLQEFTGSKAQTAMTLCLENKTKQTYISL